LPLIKKFNQRMKESTSDNNIFFKLIETYGPTGFAGIDLNDPLMIEAEEIMKRDDQFFYFGDLILFHILIYQQTKHGYAWR